MEQKANENYLEYLRRCTQALEDKIIQYSEWGDSLLGAENVYSSENLRKAFYVISKILPKIDGSQLSETTKEEQERLEALQQEIAKERIKYRDQRRELQKYITSEARFENLIEVLQQELQNKHMFPQPLNNNMIISKDSNNAILCLSDWHTGAVIENSEWNRFNIEVLRRRVSMIVDKTIYHCSRNNVDTLVIEVLGDMISGAIHVSNRVQSEENIINQIITASDILVQTIAKLATKINKVVVVVTTGNHGRLVPDKKASIETDNFERLFQYLLPAKLQQMNNVSFIFSDYDFIKYSIGDKIICAAHGQNDKIQSAIENFVKLYKVVPDEIHLGHTHSFRDINHSNIRIVVNGSLQGADEYAISVCRENNKPSQNLIIYGVDRAIYELIVE